MSCASTTTGNDNKSSRTLDRFGGATPIDVAGIPGLQQDSWLTFFLFYDLYPYYLLEPQSNRSRQVNVVDTFMHSIGRHNLRYGVDYRRLICSKKRSRALREVGFYYGEGIGPSQIRPAVSICTNSRST